MKRLAVAALLSSLSAPAFAARTQNAVVWNHTNLRIACARAVIDSDTHTWTVYHWYSIANGDHLNLGEADAVYCEKQGDMNHYWSGSGPSLCLSAPGPYTNPLFDAGSSSVCNNVNGHRRSFKWTDVIENFSWVLNP